jgi:hypothetical protein
VSTLRRYVAALGAELEISAIIGGRRVRLLAWEPQEGRVAPGCFQLVAQRFHKSDR